MPWLYQMNRTARPFVRWLCRVRVVGAENVPAQGPLIIAVNHCSYLDPWFLSATFPRYPIRYLINERWYYRSPVWTFLFRGWGVIPVATGDPIKTVGRVVEGIGQGDLVGVFPEGRISRDGTPGPMHSGVGWMAAQSGAPVLPAGLRGSFQILPRHRVIPRRHDLSLHIGEALRFPGAPLAAPDPGEVRAFVADLMGRVRRLSGQE